MWLTPIIASAVSALNNWISYDLNGSSYSLNLDVAYWEEPENGEPLKIYYCKLDQNASFSFLSGLANGCREWGDALGISPSVASSYDDADIKYYGGSISQLVNYEEFQFLNYQTFTDINGYTKYSGMGMQQYDTEYTFTLNGETNHITCYQQLKAYGFVVSNGITYHEYVKTGTHELGHALGWRGHSINSNDVMYQGSTTITTLSAAEKAHLSQIYLDHDGN